MMRRQAVNSVDSFAGELLNPSLVSDVHESESLPAPAVDPFFAPPPSRVPACPTMEGMAERKAIYVISADAWSVFGGRGPSTSSAVPIISQRQGKAATITDPKYKRTFMAL